MKSKRHQSPDKYVQNESEQPRGGYRRERRPTCCAAPDVRSRRQDKPEQFTAGILSSCCNTYGRRIVVDVRLSYASLLLTYTYVYYEHRFTLLIGNQVRPVARRGPLQRRPLTSRAYTESLRSRLQVELQNPELLFLVVVEVLSLLSSSFLHVISRVRSLQSAYNGGLDYRFSYSSRALSSRAMRL